MKVKYHAGVKRSYGQYCAVARALDLVGERWTLLIVRELLVGPRRYTDLLEGLPGIGTNLLALRLRELEKAELVQRRTLPPPGVATVYELTELGEGLREPVLALGRWGGRFLAERRDRDERRPAWYVLSMEATFDVALAAGGDVAYELRVDGEVFHVEVRDGTASFGQSSRRVPDVILATDVDTFVLALSGEVRPGAALTSGDLELLVGEREQVERLFRMFAWPRAA